MAAEVCLKEWFQWSETKLLKNLPVYPADAFEMEESLATFMSDHGFESVGDFIGVSLPYFTTHADLVKRMLREREQGVTVSLR